MVALKINGKTVKAEEGSTVLEVARNRGVTIPTLCASDALEPYGSCRLCVVEVLDGKKSTIESSCSLLVKEGLVVKTDSPRVNENRRLVIELLLARCPNVKAVQDLAKEYNVAGVAPQWAQENDNCVLCGLCVRACHEVVGAKAIQFAGSSASRIVDSPLHRSADDCIACGSCVFVCPTGHLKKNDLKAPPQSSANGAEDSGPVREIVNWQVSQELKVCKKCKNPYAPVPQLEKAYKQLHMLPETVDYCPSCRTYPVVDVDKCMGCGSCMESCPIGALEMDDRGGYDKKARVYKHNCMACHTCETHCPVLAIS